MRVLFFALLALFVAATALAWDKEDYEIFDLVSALEAAEGKGTSFYSHLGLEQSASTSEITKAYRKKSLELHPDKNPGVPDIEARFARLGVIAQILRSPERRERYNFFHKNGVPTWKGFGYAYTRWRPTLLHVFSFLALLTAGLHYLVLRLNYSRDIKRVAYFTSSALKTTKGAQGRRKVKVPMVQGGFSGETLELVVDSDEVFLPHEDGSLTPLSTLAPRPSVTSTWPFALYRSIVARIKPASTNADAAMNVDASESDSDTDAGTDGPGTPTPSARPRVKGSRAAQLRAERVRGGAGAKGDRASSAVASSGNGSAGESGTETGTGTGTGTEGEDDEEKKRKRGAGKAAGARRRKMGMKK